MLQEDFGGDPVSPLLLYNSGLPIEVPSYLEPKLKV